VTEAAGLAKTNGWWNRIAIADLNGDGYPDIIAGNHGLNSRFKASETKPITCYTGDFDENGTVEQIVCCYNGGKQYPMALRHDLVAALPFSKRNISVTTTIKNKPSKTSLQKSNSTKP